VDEAKPFKIPKRVVWKAFKRVKANRGTAGVDKQSIAEFEADLSNSLYKLWNRMCSGSYFPPPLESVNDLAQRKQITELAESTCGDDVVSARPLQ
jgi:hypothetical protein